MLRLSLSTTTGAFASRGVTGKASPSSAASTLSLLRTFASQGTNPYFCSIPSRSGRSHINHWSYDVCRSQADTPLRAASAAASPSACDADTPATCDPSVYQSLSLLFLLHECSARAYDRPLLECADLLTLSTRLDSLPCCIMLLAPAPALLLTQLAGAQATSSAPGLEHASPSHGADNAASSSVAGNNKGGGARSADARGHVGSLRVQYINRAAAEALKLVGGSHGSGGGSGAAQQQQQPAAQGPLRSVDWQVLAADDGPGADMVREVMASRGGPRRGQLAELTLTTADPHGSGGAGASGSGAPIACPQALVLPLMSPNGACAGVALLFDRWEVRGAAGQRVLLEGRPLVPEIPPGSAPTAEELAALQEGVRAQADAVRELKTSQGLANQDPRVVAAVVELQRRKAELELRQRLRSAFSDVAGPLQRLLQAAAE